MIRYIICNCW